MDFGITLEIVSTIIFFSLVGILLIRDRKNVEFHFGIFTRRWKKGLEIIDNFVNKYKRIISKAGSVAIVVGIAAGIIGFLTLVIFTFRAERAFALVLPTVAGYKIPGPVISIPFWYWIVGAFVVLASHETMHAIFARLEKIPVKNYGILLLLLLPFGAYVEPDMEKVQKLKKSNQKLKIYAAGSFANFIVALIVLILGLIFSLSASATLLEPKGIAFNETLEGYPAHEVNLTGVIKAIDGIDIKTIESFSDVLNNTKVGEKIEITTDIGKYEIKTVARPDNQSGAFIGISLLRTTFGWKSWAENYSFIFITISRLLSWLLILNLGVGTANLLPMKPFDGGFISEEILTKKLGKKGRFIASILTFVTIFLFLFNLFGTKGII